MITKSDAIFALVPDCAFSIEEDGSVTWIVPSTAPVTNEQIDAEYARLVAQEPINACKAKAVSLLQATDWTTIPDVADPAVSNPYLMNQAAFAAYRSQVRALAVNPVADPVWPVQPNEEWSQA